MNTRDKILSLTNRGLDVFHFYMPIDFVLKKNFRNPLYDDKRASCNIYYDAKSECYRMKDFGNELYSGDCFWFVATMKKWDVRTNFILVLETIIYDLQLRIEMPQKKKNTSYQPINTIRSNTITHQKLFKEVNLKEQKQYRFVEKEFTQEDKLFWSKYGISNLVLKRFNVKILARYESISSQGKPFTLMASRQEPIYAYCIGDFIKIYRPFSQVRFLYGGLKVEDYVFGMEQLPSKGDVLFITGGEKDVITLYVHGFNAICFNSETSLIPEPLIEMLKQRFKHIILLYDMDETGIRASKNLINNFPNLNLLRLELPLCGSKEEKDISDFFALGYSASKLREILTELLIGLYAHTVMMLQSCEIDYDNPPDVSRAIVSVNEVPIGTQDNLFCITGGEGTGKSNYVSAILSGTLLAEILPPERTLGLQITSNPKGKAVLHYDTEQSEAQLCKNLGKTLKRGGLTAVPNFYHAIYLASLTRKDRLSLIRESMDLFYHKHNGIHLVVIDGIADLIRSANDESESIAIVDELYRLAGIYNTCIICVLHFVPNGIKLRGHIGSELQRKSAGILSIEKDDNPALSVVKALKVRDGSPLDVPMMLFGWDKKENMHVYKGEKSKADKDKRKSGELVGIIKLIFRHVSKLSYNELVSSLMQEMEVKDRTAKKYISYMKANDILSQDTHGNYTVGKLCNT